MSVTMRRSCWKTAPLLALLVGCRADRPVGVGVALSSTFVDATRMAIEDAVAEGGLPPLDTIFFSEASNRAAPALEMADSLALVPGLVAVVGHSNSGASLAAAPIYNTHELVQIAPTSTAMRFTDAGDFSFRLVPADTVQGLYLAGVLDSLYPAGARIAVFYVNDDYGRGLRAAFRNHVDTARFPVVFDQPHTDDEFVSPPPDREAQVRRTVAAALAEGPQVILWLGRATTFRLYLSVLREVGGDLPVLGGDALGAGADLAVQADNWRNVRHADFLDLQGSAPLRDFARRYAARFGLEARTPEVLSYDAMRLILAAIRDGARTGREVREWLMTLGRSRPPFEGLSGPIAFDAKGDIARSYVFTSVVPSSP